MLGRLRLLAVHALERLSYSPFPGLIHPRQPENHPNGNSKAWRLRTGRPVVSLNGAKVGGWTFDANNVLAFEHQAGYCAWLQFTHLPGGPLFMGTFAPSSAEDSIPEAEFHVRPRFSSHPC